jgi:hypothetical protein
MLMLSLFDHSTVMAKPWAAAGYTCYCVDLQHPPGETREGNIIKVGADIMTWEPPDGYPAFAAFFPPCTHLAASGARWFQSKGLSALIEGLTLVQRSITLASRLDCPYLIENPVGTLSTYWRKPDYYFDPCDYGGYSGATQEDAYTKRTNLWVGGGFTMPSASPVDPTLGSKMHKLSKTPDRANLRSQTPAGFAQAVYLFNRR